MHGKGPVPLVIRRNGLFAERNIRTALVHLTTFTGLRIVIAAAGVAVSISKSVRTLLQAAIATQAALVFVGANVPTDGTGTGFKGMLQQLAAHIPAAGAAGRSFKVLRIVAAFMSDRGFFMGTDKVAELTRVAVLEATSGRYTLFVAAIGADMVFSMGRVAGGVAGMIACFGVDAAQAAIRARVILGNAGMLTNVLAHGAHAIFKIMRSLGQ